MSAPLATLPRRTVGPRPAPIVPQNMQEVHDFAVRGVASGLFRPEAGAGATDMVIAQATMVILKALEMGLPLTFALQTMSIKEGNVIVKADAMRSLVWGAGFKIKETIEGEGEAKTAVCVVTRPDGTEIPRRFSIADAIRAKIYTTDPDSYWQRFEDRMLAHRALAIACRDGASDVVAGLYVREEFDAPVVSNPAPARVADTVPHTAPRAGAVTDFDIPPGDDVADEASAEPAAPTAPAEPDTSPEAVLREIERRLEGGERSELVEASFIDQINAMTDQYRDAAFAMIYPDTP